MWRASLDAQPAHVIDRLHALLSRDERDRAARFYFERDRRRFIVGRGVLRTLLGQIVGKPPAEIVFRYGASGKPTLAEESSQMDDTRPLFFNVAHSEDLALYAFTRAGEVGIDVEKVRDMPDWESIAEISFSADELARLHACPGDSRREEFFRAWTRQEAVLKALGTGLGGANASDTAAFQVWPLEIGGDFAAALAVVRDKRQKTRDQRLETSTVSIFGPWSVVPGPWSSHFS